MVVTHLALELRFQGKKLRGFSCKLTRSAHGFLPESSWIMGLQVLLPYLVSGLGMVAAGIVMDIVQVWKEVLSVHGRLHDCTLLMTGFHRLIADVMSLSP